MAQALFQQRIRDLAAEIGLTVVRVSAEGATLAFGAAELRRPVFVIPCDGVWELSCLTPISVDDASRIPQAILISLLEENSRSKRGFWCIEALNGKKVLERMHNIPEDLLTSKEFAQICLSLVLPVQKLEEIVRKAG